MISSSRTAPARKNASAAGPPKSGKPHIGGGRACGYAPDRLTVIDTEAAIVKDCAARVLAGESLTSVCNDLNSHAPPHRHDCTDRREVPRKRRLRSSGLPRHQGSHRRAQCDAALRRPRGYLAVEKLRVADRVSR